MPASTSLSAAQQQQLASLPDCYPVLVQCLPLRSFNQLSPLEQSLQSHALEEEGFDTPRFFDFCGETFDTAAFDDTATPGTYYYDLPFPGRIPGEYQWFRATECATTPGTVLLEAGY